MRSGDGLSAHESRRPPLRGPLFGLFLLAAACAHGHSPLVVDHT
ncbi:hypothetical protein P376_2195 [Streptomyces sp. HCCB10043]|nr:hypothetical protein P376_2195 [Streptomyces sp. HCCB10043]